MIVKIRLVSPAGCEQADKEITAMKLEGIGRTRITQVEWEDSPLPGMAEITAQVEAGMERAGAVRLAFAQEVAEGIVKAAEVLDDGYGKQSSLF